MDDLNNTPRLVHRTAHIRLRSTRRQTDRCYGLRSAGDIWAWLLDLNRQRRQQDALPVIGYPALCRELTAVGSFGELSVVGARSVLRRYADACREAAKRRRNGQHAHFPRRRRALVPVRFYRGTFLLGGKRVRLPVAKGQPELWVRLARPIPYPAEQVRAVTLLHDGGRLWLAVTAAVPIQRRDVDPARVAGVDLGIIHPYAVVTKEAGLLVSGRAIRAENYLHLRDQQARQARVARRAPKPGRRGSRRWRRHRARVRQVEARHRRRVHQAHHEAPKQVIAFAVQQRVGVLLVGDPKGITGQDAGRAQNPLAAVAPHPPGAGAARQGRTGRHRGSAGGRAEHLLHLPGLPAACVQAQGPPVQLSALHVSGAPGPGWCPEHRRQAWRREHEHGSARACRAPSSRRGAGTA